MASTIRDIDNRDPLIPVVTVAIFAARPIADLFDFPESEMPKAIRINFDDYMDIGRVRIVFEKPVRDVRAAELIHTTPRIYRRWRPVGVVIHLTIVAGRQPGFDSVVVRRIHTDAHDPVFGCFFPVKGRENGIFRELQNTDRRAFRRERIFGPAVGLGEGRQLRHKVFDR